MSNNEHVDNFDVHFLKKSQRSHNTFTDSLSWDQANDDIDEADIVVCLPDPVVCRGIHSFAFDFSKYTVQ